MMRDRTVGAMGVEWSVSLQGYYYCYPVVHPRSGELNTGKSADDKMLQLDSYPYLVKPRKYTAIIMTKCIRCSCLCIYSRMRCRVVARVRSTMGQCSSARRCIPEAGAYLDFQKKTYRQRTKLRRIISS